MYKTAGQQITPIDMLPELEDIDGPRPFERAVKGPQIKGSRYPGENLPPGEEQRFQKVIRENHTTPIESGMGSGQNFNQPSGQDMQDQQQYLSYNASAEPEPSCKACAEHTSTCKVCKAYYGNDKTLYIIIIVTLIAICLLLFKKVMDIH